MRSKTAVLIGIAAVVLLTASSLAVFYRSQAMEYRQKYNETLARLNAMNTSPDEPIAAEPSDEPHRNSRRGPHPGAVGGEPAAPQNAPGEMASAPAQPAEVPPGPAAPTPGGERGGRRSFDWMEMMRTNDPARYAEFQQRRQDYQKSIQSAWNQATNYFLSRDTSRMSSAEVEEYNTMLALLGQTWALNQQLQSGLPPEQRREVVTALRSNIVTIAPLLENERNREYYDAAITMGQSPENAASMVSYINQITSNTSLRAIIPGLRFGGDFGGRGRGGPDGGPGGGSATSGTRTR